MIKACVIGYPLGYSRSPAIHRYWFSRYGIEGTYDAVPVAPESLKENILRLAEQGYAGFNATIPFKETIVPFCHTIDDAARAIGAVNTVVIDKSGKLQGRNTDATGFALNLQQKYPGYEWQAGTAFVLGAGGAARAILHALKEKKVPRILIANRTEEKAQQLAQHFEVEVVPWKDRESVLKGIHLLVNTTALGMTGKPPLDLSLVHLNKSATVYDIVYAPLMTPLLQNALAQGNPVVTGIGMLLHQAAPAFEAWTGVRPEVDSTLERIVLEAAA